MTTEKDIKELLENAWKPAVRIWGGDKYGIMNFLQAEWEKTDFTMSVDYTQENVSDTAKMVLEHWYKKYPHQNPWTSSTSEVFLKWLHDQYKEYLREYERELYRGRRVHQKKLNPPDNRPLPPRKKRSSYYH